MDLPSRLLSLLACLALTGVASAVAPSLTNISTLDGGSEDQDTTISYDDLANEANEFDGDGDVIVFRFKSLSSGTLKKNGTAVAVDGTLAAGEEWVWTPAPNANGTLEAFTVRAFAGGQESFGDEPVDIAVDAVNDAPSFTAGANVTVNEDSGAYSQNWATGISPGPANENSQDVSFTITSNSNAALFSAGPAVNDLGRLTFTPAANANGTATIGVRVVDNGGTANSGTNQSAIQTFTINVNPVNDAPSFTDTNVNVAEDSGAFSQANWATNISPGPADESGQTTSFTITNNTNAALFSTAPALTASGTLTFTPAANENGSATISVRINDDGGTANGGANQSAVQTFTITVTPQDDAPTITATMNGTAAAPLLDTASTLPGGEAGPVPAQKVFQDATIADVDHNKPSPESLIVVVTVPSIAESYGTFALPGSTVANVSGGKTYTLSGQSPSNATADIKLATFTPLSNAHPVGLYNFGITVAVRDGTPLSATPLTPTLNVKSVSDLPTANASLAVASITDAGPVSPFRLTVNDVDEGDTFSVTITETSTTLRGALSATTVTGAAAQIGTAIQNLVYTPFQQNANQTATFDFDVTDVHPDGSTGTVGPPATPVKRSVSLPITFVNDAPEFTGLTTSLIRMTDDPGALPVYPFSSISIIDGDPAQVVTVTLSLGDQAQGSFSGPVGTFSSTNVITGTVSEITTKLRQVRFVPTPGRIPVNSSETITITITLNDGTASVSNNQTQVEVTAVDGAPSLLWNGNPVFPLSSSPALIDPSTGPKPFAQVTISDVGQVEVTVALDTVAKGSLSNLGAFVETPAGSRSYRFTGTAAAAQTAIRAINYDINPNYLFPPNQPGRTDFTISATDSALNFTSRVLPILLTSDARSFLVTHLLDDETVPGTLRHAITHAVNNDVIVFALPSYPATIRLNKTKGPLVLTKHLSFRGPGADKLTITGDSNANATTDSGDVQLFRIFASVQIQGVRLARGFADTGGAAFVGRLAPTASPGSLVIEDCVIANCLASQWGGAIDVYDGALKVSRSVFENNALNASAGLGGGAVSLFTNHACSFTNTTFSGNSQPASTGLGGGALYVENDTPTQFVQTTISHCTFAGNADAAISGGDPDLGASSLFNNVSNSRVLLANNIFADFSTRNLKVYGSAEIVSNGGNISNDNTTTEFLQGGTADNTVLLGHITDKRNLDPKLAPIATLEGTTRGHRLLPDSPAVGTGIAGVSAVDQRGVIRNATCDMGAIDANALGKLIVHEVFPATNPNQQFIEFYMPRDQASLDLTGYEVWIDGEKRHTFTAQVIAPGHGLVLAETLITAAGSTPVIVSDESLDLLQRGRMELRKPFAAGNAVVEAVSFVAAFANATTPSVTDDYSTGSITLAPQYQGAAFAPHRLVQAPPTGGILIGANGAATSPGADTAGTPFGEDNAYPIATIDSFEITEDVAQTLMVRANDLDADGADELFIVDLNQTLSAIPPVSNKSTISTTSGATVTVTPAGSPLRGTAVNFDPRVAFNHLPEGARFTDTFAYSIVDVGGGAVGGYADGGTTKTLVTAPAHRLVTGASVTIRDAGFAGYNVAHTITVVDDDHFSIPVAFLGNPAPLLRGRWQAAALRTPSARDEALVQVSVLGRNDPPTPAADSVATNEDTILRVFADPRVSNIALDTDALYPAPRTFNGTGILANDTDPDTDGNPFTQLKVIGVCQAKAIGGFSGTAGVSPVTVTAPGHGLSTGATVLISGYGGHPSYNGYHVVTVASVDTFTLPIAFVDDAATKGLWAVLTNENRLSTTSKDGAAVTLEIRANRNQTNLVYNPRPSAFLDGLADGESSTDTFYYAAEDNHGAVSLAQLSVVVAGVNNDPVPSDNPPGLAALDPLLTGGLTAPQLLDGSAVLHLLPASGTPGRVNVSIRPPGGAFGDIIVIDGLDQTDEDTELDLVSADILANDSDIDRTDVLSLEIRAGQNVSREGAAISLSPDGATLTYDPTGSATLQALAFKERVIDTFTVTVFDGIARVNTLIAVMVEGRNDSPTTNNLALTINEETLLEVPTPGLLFSGLDIDQNTLLPDNRKFLKPTDAFPTNVFAAKVNVLLDRRDGSIDTFASISGTPGATAVVSTDHGLVSGEEVVLLGSGALTGQFVVTKIDGNTFSVPVAYNAAFASLGGGTWTVLASTFQYDPRESVFSDLPGGPTYTLQGLAVGETFVDSYTYTLQDGSFLFANDDIYRIEADRSDIELKVLLNDVSLEGLATGRRIVAVGPLSGAGTAVLNGDQSLIYTPETGFVGDEVFSYTIEDNLGNRDTAMVTARVTIDRLNGNLRANDDQFTVAAGQAPLVDVLANDSIIPATGDPLTLASISSAPDEGGLAVIENGKVRYTPNPSITTFPYTETFEYTMNGGGTTAATATVSMLVVNRANTLNVRADAFSVPVGSVSNTLNVLENDNILPGNGENLDIVSVTTAAHGTVTVMNGVALSYTPAAAFLGTDSFSYSVTDGLGGTGIASVTVKVGYLTINSDIFSVAFDDPGKLTDDGTTVLDVLANDNVLQGGSGQLTITNITPASAAVGAISVTPGGTSLTFNPAAGATGQQDFTYTVTDVGGRTSTGTVTVVVIAGGIRASSDYFTVQGDSQSTELTVLSNDLRISDLPGALSVASIGTGLDAPDQGGTVEVSADFKKLVYTPATGFRGVESFTYTVTDGDSTDTARVSVRSTDGEMVAGDDAFLVFRGSSENRLPVLANDRVIPDGGQQIFITAVGDDPSNVSNPAYRGTLDIIEDGAALRYTPNALNPAGNYIETFTYEISAGGTDRREAVISIEVLNRAGARDLETNHDRFSVRSDSTGTLLPVLANDSVLPASASEWIITEVTTPSNGAVQIVGSNLLYAPQPGFVGTEVFTYKVSDGFGGTGQADVTVKVGDISVSDDHFTLIAGDGVVALDVTANDGILRTSFPETPLPSQADFTLTTARAITLDPVNAGTAVVADGKVSYTPDASFTGRAALTYWVQDDSGNEYPGVAHIDQRTAGEDRDSATVSITVTGVNDAPRMVNAETNGLNDKSTLHPFPNVTVIEYDSQRLEPVVIRVSFAAERGILAGGGFTLVSPGVIEFTGTAAQATIALRALVFTPTIDRIVVGTTEDTQFTVSMDDSYVTTPVIEDSTVTTVTPVNDAPTLLNAVTSATNDKTPIKPFPASTFVEIDDLTVQPLEVIVTYPGDRGTLAGAFTQISPGVLKFNGTAAQATTALRGLVYTPVENRITVGTTENTKFTVSIDDGFTTVPVIVDTAIMTVTPVNDAPVLTGTAPGATNDKTPVKPFPSVTLMEVDDLTIQPLEVTVSYEGDHGTLAGTGFTQIVPGTLVFNGTAAQATTALRGLTYTPFIDRIFIGTTEDTHFTVDIDDGFTPALITDDETVITVTPVNDAPQLLGAIPGATNDKTAMNPFATSTVIEVDNLAGQLVRVRVTFPADRGTLSGPGFTLIAPGVLEFYGTAANATIAIRGLVFTPFLDRITVGTTEQTRFTVSLNDAVVSTPVIVDTAVVTVTPVNDVPVITGTVDDQELYQRSSLRPFVGVNITDIDDLAVQPLTVTIQIDNAIKGTLSNLVGFTLLSEGSGTYRMTGSPAAVSTALRGLVFTPTPGTRITPTAPEIARLTITIQDGFAAPVIDDITTIEILHAEVDQLLALGATGLDASQTGAGFGTSSAISKDTLVIGSPLRDTPSVDVGRVQIYERSSGFGAPWGQVADIGGTDAGAGDLFGQAVAIDGDYMVVGAPGFDQPGGSNAGAAYIFQRNPTNQNAWTQVAKINPPVINGSGGDAFGSAVALQGDTVLIGAPNANLTGAPRSGRVFVFKRGATPSAWTLSQTLVAADNRVSGQLNDSEFYGAAVAIDGNTVVIGSHGANYAGNSTLWNFGAAYIYTRPTAAGGFTEFKRLDQFDGTEAKAYGGFGYAVDISGDRIAVGVHSVNAPFGGLKPGRVRIYERDSGGANQWGLVREAAPADGVTSRYFGYSVAISGNLLLVGAPAGSEGSLETRGSVEILRRSSGTADWLAIDRITHGASASGNRYGNSVALDGFSGVAGSSADSVNATGAGGAGSARVLQLQYDLGPRLAVPVLDQLAVEGSPFSFTVNAATFGDPVYPGQLTLAVRLSDGSPLPPAGWLSFNPATGAFTGTPTAVEGRDYSLQLVATNPLGSQVVSNVFRVYQNRASGSLAAAYAGWATGQFTPSVLSNSALEASVWGINADADHDGRANVLEMLFGLNANQPDQPQLVFTRISATQYTLSYPQTEQFPAGEVAVEWSINGTTWTTTGVVLTPGPAVSGIIRVTASITSPLAQQKVFVRIVAGD
ncbi:Ig-like domain-containing protein [Luteolibacter arcticus]|uniref:Ig-like domain-containing protein n=1 Tax=Luteolibacter arcticus TaxID=1581411 RepID=A0ABT3GEU1_9BACT|nr:Ig-like domain-containing protein [Luteolibacter arcticus]MCW1922135.1 Ig-like domain-containing protein [Luteolibacter arcticus]